MGFRVYPDPATAPLLVPSQQLKESSIKQMAGASDFAGYVQMMFVRVAMFGGTVAPTLFLSADRGQPVALTTNVAPLNDEASHYIGDVRLRVEAANVWQIEVGFDRMSQNAWVLGIRNNDPTAGRVFTWVVADKQSETAQPWIDVAPASLRFTAWVGETTLDNVTVSNYGTAAFAITGVNPVPPPSFEVRTPSGVVPPSGTAQITVGFTAPQTPPLPDGVTSAATTIVTAPTDTTVDQHANHNNHLALHATTRYREPAFDDAAGRQFDPKKGVVGDPVVLKGTNFNVGTPEVLFGTVKATGVSEVSASSLKVSVPTGVIPPGQSSASVKITIRTEGGQDVTDDQFQVTAVPAFDAPGRQFDPKKGAAGTPVVLRGANFNLGLPEVFFGTVQATGVSEVSASSLKVSVPGVIPPGQSSASVKITVLNQGGSAVSDDRFQVLGVPAFGAAGDQFEPMQGVVGTAVVLRGANFNVGIPEVLFGTVQATGVSEVSASSMKVPVPAGVVFPAGQSSASVKITVRNQGGSDVSDDQFQVLGVPRFGAAGDQFEPKNGVVGTAVVLRGANFNVGIPEVLFGTVQATGVSEVSASSMKVLVPAGVVPAGQPSASVRITVRNQGGSDVSDDQFQVVAKPTFAQPGQQLKPHRGTNRTPVVLKGANFDISGVRVKFGEHVATLDGQPTATSMRVLVPATIAAGTDTKVTVTTSAGEDTSDDIFLVRKEIRRRVQVVNRSGDPVSGVAVARVAANGTYLSGATDGQGVWVFTDTYFGTVTLMVGGAGWSGFSASYEPEQWVGQQRVVLTSAPKVGSLLILQGTGNVPGLNGRLNPIRDSSDRLYIYADNISINDDPHQPASFVFGRPFKAVDAAGTTFMLTVIDMIGRTALIRYEFVSRPSSDIGRSVRVVNRSGAPVSGVTVARVAANGTYLQGVTDAQGVWAFRDTYPGKVTLMVGGAGWSSASVTFDAGQWAAGEKRVVVSSMPNVGSLVVQETGYVPGLNGRLNPIRDNYDRLYIYADNISINDNSHQPASFEFGRPFKAADAAGATFMLTVIDMIGSSALIQYEFVARPFADIGRSVRVGDDTGAAVPGIAVARVAANGTWLQGVTDGQGIWSFRDTHSGKVTLMAGGPGWSGASNTYESDEWAGDGVLTVSPVPDGGTAIVPTAGHMPSADAICVKQDYDGRTFMYADNLAIDEGPGDSTLVTIGDDVSAIDAEGTTMVLNVVAVAGQSSLIRYRNAPSDEAYEYPMSPES